MRSHPAWWQVPRALLAPAPTISRRISFSTVLLADPINVYGRTKLAGEQAVRNADPAALVVRTSWVYSASRNNFVGTMLRLMKRGDSISVVADQVGTPTCADSLAEALWAFVATGAEGILHYTDAGVASWYDLAVAIWEEAAPLGLVNGGIEIMPIGTEDYPTAARRPAYSVLDKREAWAIQGRSAPHWRVNLRRMLKGLSANG
jgi:dTDP-4-dehydrorhamnose reductase